MIPVNRVRPTDAEIIELRRQVSTNETTVDHIAERYGIGRTSVYRWLKNPLKNPRTFLYEKDPAGFDAACLEVSRGEKTIFAASRQWQAGSKRVRDRILALTGKPAKRYCPTKQRGLVSVELKKGRAAAERAKRERLRRELEALLKQPYRVAA